MKRKEGRKEGAESSHSFVCFGILCVCLRQSVGQSVSRFSTGRVKRKEGKKEGRKEGRKGAESSYSFHMLRICSEFFHTFTPLEIRRRDLLAEAAGM